MKEDLEITNFKDKEFIYGLMVVNMMDIGKIIR